MKFTGERVVPTDMHRNVDTYQQHLLRYVWALKYVANKNVIDAACGTGYGTALIRQVAYGVIGLDISEEAILYANTVYPGITFQKLDLDELTSKKAEPFCEVIVTFETIEHLNDPKKFIEWCKATAPLVVGSIPINCPTEFHKHNYTYGQATQFVADNFAEYEMWHQDELILRPLAEANCPKHGMILFVGRR